MSYHQPPDNTDMKVLFITGIIVVFALLGLAASPAFGAGAIPHCRYLSVQLQGEDYPMLSDKVEAGMVPTRPGTFTMFDSYQGIPARFEMTCGAEV